MLKNNQETQEYFFEEGCYITEWWNEIQDNDVSIARARVRPGQTTRKHALKKTVERYLILQGQGLVSIGAEPPRPVKENDVVLIPAGTSQSISNSSSEDLVFLAVCTPRFKKENYQAIE